MFVISETVSPIVSYPKTIKNNKEKIIFECVLQTVGDVNRNKRRYTKEAINDGIRKIKDRIKEGSLLGELDHPVNKDVQRQLQVLYKEASHRILEVYWNGRKLMGVVETLRTPNGYILKNLAEDKIPVGFSFRGMGEVKKLRESGQDILEVIPPLHPVTWDAVSYPSHSEAKMVRILESGIALDESEIGMIKIDKEDLERFIHKIGKKFAIQLLEEFIENSIINGRDFKNSCISKGIICDDNGICYLPKTLFRKMIDSI